MDLIKIAEEAFATGKQHPSFKAGETFFVTMSSDFDNNTTVQLYTFLATFNDTVCHCNSITSFE